MIFILDNLDSFTYNLYQYFGELGEEVIVRRADECHLKEIEELNPELIVISPGPCTPNEAQLSLQVITELQGKIPILGVCLGHQAIGQVFGGKVIRAQVPIHGKTSLIRHDNSGVFQNLPNPLEVTRYHSLILERHSLPPELIITADTEQGEIMGIRHCSLPIEGVQFHPEAILTSSGHDILSTAVANARQWLADKAAKPWLVKPLAWDELPDELLPAQLFPALRSAADPFFLDSGADYGNLGRYSFMGAFPFLRVTATKDRLELLWPDQARKEVYPLTERKSLSWLDELLAKYRLPNSAPFPFAGGAVGYFSYDLKDELEKLGSCALDDLSLPLWRLAWYDGIIIFDHQEHQYWLTACGMNEAGVTSPQLAAARLHRLEALISEYLHASKHSPAESTYSAPDSTYSATDSMHSAPKSPHSTLNSTRSFSELACSSTSSAEPERNSSPEDVIPGVPRAQYLKDLSSVIEYIYAGDIYQANLTQRFALSCTQDPWELYQHLHAHNPAPFAAFLPYEDFQLLSSSPERFLRIDANGLVETRPIKGTRPRKALPAEDQAMANELFTSPKDRAELTMIIDLERNDLGRIAKFGTVQVQDLIRLEKYPTVWHLVSTVTAQLRDGIAASEILKAVFPGGSITGAPKIRAMEIIEELEPYKRGVYTGSIGYIGFDGAWDLNIVIRTIILKNGQAFVNVGGGIVADSRPENEYDETLDKAQALFTVLAGVLNTSASQEEA